MKALTVFAAIIILLGIMILQNATANCAGDYMGYYHSLYKADVNHPCPTSSLYNEYNLYGSGGGDFDLYVFDSWNNTWYKSTTTGYNEYVKVPVHCGYSHTVYVWTYNRNGTWSVCSPQVNFAAGFRRIADSSVAPDRSSTQTTITTTTGQALSIVGRWTLSFDWECDGSPGENEVIFYSDGTFGDDTTRDKGNWERDGQSIRWEYNADPNALYRGTLSGLYMSGTMSTNAGRMGCWSARKGY